MNENKIDTLHGIQEDEQIKVVFVFPDGSEKECEANIGETLLNVIRNNDIPIPCSCGGALACSTCHVVLDEKSFNILESDDKSASEDEEDLLEVASGLEDTSRLGCQVILTEELNGMRVQIPR
ncbi:2Fe-2S iron-sulfur cluster binding domain-containing protein [Candidatus Cytomitobacter indipagum]|uniref:2Fe-2S iron-sulfur cluster binding domain-containing protein n=1 Tax=Candidatus Cytomitobacter indipagum TaxID=2601575 RepID=A0A5C0UDX0_9PROT|nr:2Fe-2S iron-sulfur cluster-binding protein [Candidatus Cytomitobacter indipagum]QEK38266.1 2Fe-2S iron-sulfur cluster binding domain-containing protein [Candidatus Cytomitobacter indipagum]